MAATVPPVGETVGYLDELWQRTGEARYRFAANILLAPTEPGAPIADHVQIRNEAAQHLEQLADLCGMNCFRSAAKVLLGASGAGRKPFNDALAVQDVLDLRERRPDLSLNSAVDLHVRKAMRGIDDPKRHAAEVKRIKRKVKAEPPREIGLE